MIERRSFLKGGMISLVALNTLEASILTIQKENLRYSKLFIKDLDCQNISFNFSTEETLIINKDIANIYTKLDKALNSDVIIGGVGSKTTFFILKEMMRTKHTHIAYYEEKQGEYAFIITPKGVKL
ncbi:transcriptional initiation protein Tat [Helicobacter burdigaliensis]|uniref:transcriptional initiation protein Tat n=1 Tax=Helicobacter burdigaliensis TaxID=2315334 RepID=UPI000EF71F49|nr:transcriptional initiation protein Tat [Helicobacter burdigaliensis]